MSHDLRAPLRGVHGFTQILMEDYGDKLDDEGKHICNTIRENSIRMGKLIDDLLSFSRLSRTDLQKAPVKMKKLVSSVLEELIDQEISEHVDVKINDLCDAPADVIMIRHVWTNLIANAIKYSSKRGQSLVEISCSENNGFYEYCVKDNGVGFDMQYSNKLFGVFQRLHTSKEFEGTGVGLAIVKRIVQKHGGDVRAEGILDHGAAFYFTLPKEELKD